MMTESVRGVLPSSAFRFRGCVASFSFREDIPSSSCLGLINSQLCLLKKCTQLGFWEVRIRL